jgi:hypothetical protein
MLMCMLSVKADAKLLAAASQAACAVAAFAPKLLLNAAVNVGTNIGLPKAGTALKQRIVARRYVCTAALSPKWSESVALLPFGA